ncbi:Subtilisin-like protease SBT4.3 [Sesamum alatum]|uniref:Subtilisin-like protease SBT4.3 n=1 Tax=Sesamum alatum TaxID=300844 RepID=A0AAE1YH21_9LAMI|nr:Subtilisin-like protease SBT4.3 [Sesamum alatum]
MANFCPHRFSFLLLVVFVIFSTLQTLAAEEDRQVYIVYMGNLVERDQSPSSYHFSMLQEVVDRRFLRQSLLRSYTRSFNGFAAYLTAEEQEKLARHEEVVSVFPSTTYHPQTTRSWDFMGLVQNVHRDPTVESDIIIGVIDTGIWPESESFNDKGYGPPPKKWKGACKGGKNFTCNNKLIGARYYNSHAPIDDSARDRMGHGTHTASTAAGNYVKDASFYGIAEGTARGGVPSARIAAYKVCYPLVGCQEADILAAFDDAIADGVDIITISVGGVTPSQFTNDSMAIGAFHASQNGILVVQSAGNKGAEKKTIASVVPWIFTVAASTTDRGIITKVELGNGSILNGKGINSFSLNRTSYPLVYGEDVSRQCGKQAAQNCMCLEKSLVKGKIVLCNTYTGIIEAYNVGALGSVALSDYITDVSFILPIAASSLHEQDFHVVQSYFGSTKFPKMAILTSESGRDRDAPMVGSFSSRGPNTIMPDILKPDITAPGVEILAAYSPVGSVSSFISDKSSAEYTILSGTSMSCPHAAGAAAYVKSVHPDWSPSAIKSAIMTTAWPMDPTKHKDAEFSYGAGHLNPINATNPGLVYETNEQDYIKLLCNIGYSIESIRKLFNNNSIDCPKQVDATTNDFNYPSMSLQVVNRAPLSASFTRTVTNVGPANSTYTARINKPANFNITVEPGTLSFKQLNEKQSFVVTVKGDRITSMISASLVWSDGIHSVYIVYMGVIPEEVHSPYNSNKLQERHV